MKDTIKAIIYFASKMWGPDNPVVKGNELDGMGNFKLLFISRAQVATQLTDLIVMQLYTHICRSY
jgi:hypothetical protein